VSGWVESTVTSFSGLYRNQAARLFLDLARTEVKPDRLSPYERRFTLVRILRREKRASVFFKKKVARSPSEYVFRLAQTSAAPDRLDDL